MVIGLAFKAFFLVLFRNGAAEAVQAAIENLPPPDAALTSRSGTGGAGSTVTSTTDNATGSAPASPTAARPGASPSPTSSSRSDALTLLSTLQREARFLDLVGESLDGFEDAQVGAAARQVISDVRKALDRMFGIEPLASQEEGSSISIPRPTSPVRYHVIGRNSEQASRGTLVHRGWKAQRAQTPTWNGAREDAYILSPVEIDVDGQ